MAHLARDHCRPREIRGPDKQPARFPLEITTDELVDLCGPGVYRIYALDEVGTLLANDHVAKWDLTPGARELRNGASFDGPSLALRPSAPAGGVTDLRFALEAMQHMMRANSDALRIVAESHVDLAKTLATAKGLPRNAAFVAPALAPAPDGDENDDDDDQERPRHFVELLLPIAQKLAEAVPGLVMGKVMQPNAGHGGATKALAPATESSRADDELANRPGVELRDFVDLSYAKRKADAKRSAKVEQAAHASTMASLQGRIMADATLMQHLFAIKQQLAADEVDTLMATVARSSEAEQLQFIDSVKALPVEGAAVLCRELVMALREQSTHGVATATNPGVV